MSPLLAQPWLVTAGNILLLLATIPAVLSVLAYLRVPWRRSRLGRHLMSYMFCVALVLMLSDIRVFAVVDPQWFVIIRLVAFALLVITLWWRLIVVMSAQRSSGRQQRRRKRADARRALADELAGRSDDPG